MPRLHETLQQAARQLSAVSETPRLDAELLLAQALGLGRAQLLSRLRDEAPLPKRFQKYLERRLNHEPIAYILGQWEFFSRDFYCQPPTLVPRPETEHLVEAALDYLNGGEGEARVLDLCTGTGCIAISVALNAPKARLTATDIDADAIKLAHKNAVRHHCDLPFYQGDLFAALPPETPPFDLILSNPPYVKSTDWPDLDPVIRKHEDPKALLSGPEGLDCLLRILREASSWMQPGAMIALEMDPLQQSALKAAFEAKGYTQPRFINDLSGRPRIACAIAP